MPLHRRAFLGALVSGSVAANARPSTSGEASEEAPKDAADLFVVRDGEPRANVVISVGASQMEEIAAADLIKYVQLMSGATLPLQRVPSAASLPAGAALVIGQAALWVDFTLRRALTLAAKKQPLIQADAIVIRRVGDRVLLAGNNEPSHYSAVSQLLQNWGCRWYMPTEFGECVPEIRTLALGEVDYAYGSPFEIRSYWLSWLGDDTGKLDFQRRNFAGTATMPGASHALGAYTKGLLPEGSDPARVPLSEPATAAYVASKIDAEYARGVPGISLGIEDKLYVSDSQSDKRLQAGLFDKYMLGPVQTDALMTLYNNVAGMLRRKYPQSPTLIGGLAYANVTLPPQAVTQLDPHIVMWLAPIDIDPNHSMQDARSPPRREYRAMMRRWAQLLQGRLAIYDYDQAQLVWRDLPNPSHHVFARDVREYRDAGILGISTESRGATATTFLNLFFRLQLMWNPGADVDSMLAEFYPKFYGPAAAPMKDYWGAIYSAWQDTLVTEHEYFIAPAIYTPEVISRLRAHLQDAKSRMSSSDGLGRNGRLYAQRLRFTELSFELIDSYLGMVRAAARDADYARAVRFGQLALAARAQLTRMSPTFTTYEKIGEKGPAWLPGEVAQMGELAQLTDGGRLLQKLPLEWLFRTDPHDQGLAAGWAYSNPAAGALSARCLTAGSGQECDDDQTWRPIRTDLYAQAQNVLHADGQSFTGFLWYATQVRLDESDVAGQVHLMFPGLFNQCWLYVNGILCAHRAYQEPWSTSDYRFEWDVDLTGRLQAGTNSLCLRSFNPHHFGGMFRRPFLFRTAV